MQTQTLGRRIVYYERIGSTNDAAKQLADAGEPEGAIVVADEQTAGRGRLGRVWLAPPRSSILMSMILRPHLAPAQAPRVTMAVALGACDGIRSQTGLAVQLKWPNDLLVRGKKVAGILAESGIVGDQLEYVVVGIGVNVNFDAASIVISSEARILSSNAGDFSVAPLPRNDIPTRDATTIADELGKAFPRARLTQALLRGIEKYYLRVNEDLRAEYCNRLATLNQFVRAQTLDGIIEGVAESVNENGALVLRRADGSRIELLAGDVTLFKTQGG